ncbi:RND family transporter [Acidaminobacter sp. JC074]|uniref:efflux RND transporter permease subunit n=1 Tax=Acidaminobacter sp. JC074 TaxID=2530199 RepID=UPI001F0D950D|nr:MMPL family transporter [Acidaminobacter sp. JC074]MCH4886705.1 RND family transporter [Acidaminobacter sp. JC074]
MKRYIDFIYKYKTLLIILFFILMGLSARGIHQLDINADFDIFKLNQSEASLALNEMNEVFGESEQTILMMEIENLDEIETISQVLDNESIRYVSPSDMLKALNLDDYKLLGNLSPVVKKDGQTYIIYTLYLDEAYDLSDLYQALDGYTFYLSGNRYMQDEIISLILSIFMFLPPLALILILLTFRSQLGSFKAALLSVLPAAIGAFWTMGLAGWFGGELSIITVLAPIFTIVIGSADGLHFVSHMEDSKATRKEAITQTLSMIGVPMIITTTTSVAGFIGLTLIPTKAIQQLAIFASLGITLAGLVTWYVLPLLLTFNISLKEKKSRKFDQSIKKIWGKPAIAIILVLLVVSSFFIPSINSEFNQLMFFKSSTDVQKNFEKIIAVNDGAMPMYFFGQTSMDSSQVALGEISAFLNDLEENDLVSKVMNPFKILKDNNQPPPSVSRQFIRIVDNKIYFRLMFFPLDLENETLDQLEALEGPLDSKLIGNQLLMKEMNASLISNQVRSLVFTFILILIMLIISLRSIKLTFIASLPIIITSVVLYGFLGITQIPLNVMTATIFSISLGIGIDYAIHYVSIYKYYKKNKDPHARETAFKYTSKPILANAFGLSLGMTALMLSPLKIHVYVSLLMWVAMMTSVFLSLSLIPTLLKEKSIE